MGLLLGLPALLGICLGLRKYTNLPMGATPLAGLACVYLVLFVGGIGGVLPLAAGMVTLLGWLLLAAEAYRSKKEKNFSLWKDLRYPGSVLFWGGGALLLLRLIWLRPSFLNFDEYSFWGTAVRLLCENGTLYPACETGRPWVMTELPGIPLMGYWLQMAGHFSPWRAIFAVDLLLLAALAAAVSCCEKKSPRLWGPMAVALVLLPTAMTIPAHTEPVNTTWLEILGDLPAGILFGGAVAFWLAVRGKGRRARWLVLPVLCLAGSIKSNTLPLALTAAGMILLDWVLLPPKELPQNLRAFAGRLGFGLAALAAPVVQYGIWSRYVQPFVLANAAGGGMGDTANATLPEVVINGVKMLLGGTGTPFFEARRADLYAYADTMTQAFFQRDVSIFGTGAAVCTVIGLVFLLALLAAPDLRQRLRVLLAAASSTICFGGYWLMLLLSYSFLFKDSAPTLTGLASYPRYMDSCYAGWLLLALAMLARQAAKKYPLRGFAGAWIASAVMLTATLTAWQPQFTILGVNRNVYAENEARSAQVAQLREQLDPTDRVFLIRQGDDGFYWFWYAQELLPNIVPYGAGGGTYGCPAFDQGQPYYQSYTKTELAQLIRDSNADVILTAQIDPIFVDSYGTLFTDGLKAAQSGPALYRVTPSGYSPMSEGEEASA